MHRPELNSVERDRSSHRQFRRGRQPVVAQNTRSRPFCERGHACLKDHFDIIRNGTDRVSGPFNGLHRLYNRATLIFELAQCLMQRSFLRGQLPEARFPLVKSTEVFGNVRGSVPITRALFMERNIL